MPDAFPSNSILMKVVSVCLTGALVLQIIALASNYWTYDSQNRRIGLFSYFSKANMDLPDPSHVDPFTKLICPLVAVVSLFILFIACVLATTLLQTKYHLAMPAVMVFSFVSGMSLLLVVIGWAVPHRGIGWRLAWAYGLTVIVAMLDLFSSVLCVVEFIKRRSQLLNMNLNDSTLENLNRHQEEEEQEEMLHEETV